MGGSGIENRFYFFQGALHFPRMIRENRRYALIYTLTCVVLWSFIPIVSRFGQASLDNYQFLFWSSILSFIVVSISTGIAGKLSQLKTYSTQEIGNAFVLGFLGTCLYYLFLYYGYAHAEGLEVLVLQYTWPVFIVILSLPFLRETLTLRTGIATALGFAGVVLVLSKGNLSQIHLENLSVDFMVLLGAGAFGLFSVLSKKVQMEPLSLTTYFFISGTICSFIAMMLFSSFAIPTKESLIAVLVNGAFINGLSYILWLKALQHGKASFVAPLVFFTPVLSAFLIILFFGEPLIPVYLLGLVAVIGAGIISR